MALTTVAAEVYRDYPLDGVPSSGLHEPKKPDIRRLLGGYERVINAFTSAGGLIYDTRALLYADLAKSANSLAWVVNDLTAGFNGIYMKIGASGGGSWERSADLPYSFIVAEDAGAGTANAIEATSELPISSSALVQLNIFQANGPGPVTVRFNGEGPVYTIKTNTVNDPAAGGLLAGMQLIGRVSGATFRLYTDQVSSAIVAQAEAAQVAADAAAATAEAAAATAEAIVGFDGSAETVSFNNSASDLVATNVQAAIDELAARPTGIDVLPEDFGCVGDGITDDTVNFDAAMDAAIAAGATLVLGRGKTYLLSTWPSSGYSTNGKVFIDGRGCSGRIRGPIGTSYFLRPGAMFEIRGVAFDRWTGVLRRDAADGGSIVGARFCDNEITNITGIPFNIEITFKDSVVGGNRMTACSGGYGIRIGENTYANQDKWAGNLITWNVLRSFTATGETSGFPLLIQGRDTVVSYNVVDGLTSANGEAVGIYVKLRHSKVIYNTVRNINATGTSGLALDVAGISLKGAIRSVTNSGVQGFQVVCHGNQVERIGAQNVKGSGIRCQISHSTVSDNMVYDCGLIGISSDDSNGSSYNKIIDNTIEGFNVLGQNGIDISTNGTGIVVRGNSIKDYVRGIAMAGAGGSGTLLSTLVEGNSIDSTRASSSAFFFNSGVVGALVVGNFVNTPAGGFVVVNNSAVTRVNIRNNDFAVAIANGATLLAGSATSITMAANP